jgi:hypothetical protein
MVRGKKMNVNNMRVAMSIADAIEDCDSGVLILIATALVNKNRLKADALEHALSVAQHEKMLAYGFSDKVNAA